MLRPGTVVASRSAPPARNAGQATGTWFVAITTLKGQVGVPILINNMSDYVSLLGTRQSNSYAYDAADTFFREGGTRMYVSRIVGPAAAKDTVTLNDAGNAASIRVDSLGPGATDLTVQVVAGSVGGTFVLVIFDAGVEVSRSYDLADVAAAVTWASTNRYVRVTALGSNDPAVVSAQALASGTDDFSSITDTHRVAALDVFERSLGPGQVSIPGATTTAAHVGVLNHALATSRVALLDATNTATVGTLTSQADAILASGDLDDGAEERGGLFAPWDVVPGIIRNTTRTVPPSARVAGLMSRNDARTGNPNLPAAGVNGVARYAVDLTQVAWSATDRNTLNTAGVNVSRVMNGGIRLYGYRTLDNILDSWAELSAARTRMAIEHEGDQVAEEFVFAQIDGSRHKIAEYGGAVTAILQRYYAMGALFGESTEDAFAVDVGPAVNTIETIAANELHAVVGIKTSPYADLVFFEMVKVPITESI